MLMMQLWSQRDKTYVCGQLKMQRAFLSGQVTGCGSTGCVEMKSAFAFAKQMAAHPQHASLNLIPVVVRLEVSTVQQEGESFDATKGRPISAQNLVPLYLWPFATTVERKPMTLDLMGYLSKLPRIRVEDTDEGLALMQVCHVCSRKAYVGAQISNLRCDHAFHSHCVVRLLEDNNLCPLCHSPAYDRLFLTCSSPYVVALLP